jgi:hypothetical protein
MKPRTVARGWGRCAGKLNISNIAHLSPVPSHRRVRDRITVLSELHRSLP